jgi:hypothetical protein
MARSARRNESGQAAVLQAALQAADDANVDRGLWLPIDLPHEVRPELTQQQLDIERSYGLLGVVAGNVVERAGLSVWDSLGGT